MYVHWCFQHEINRKRESELIKYKKDYDLLVVQYESAESSMRKKHTDAVNELNEQLDFLSKNKNK